MIKTTQYRTLLRVLRRIRSNAGITQVQLAERINETQSFASKVERGNISVDLIQLRTNCRVLGTDLVYLASELVRELKHSSHRTKSAKRK